MTWFTTPMCRSTSGRLDHRGPFPRTRIENEKRKAPWMGAPGARAGLPAKGQSPSIGVRRQREGLHLALDAEVAEGNSQVKEGGAAVRDQLAVLRVDHRQGSRPVGVQVD